jgi:hypothetical protein
MQQSITSAAKAPPPPTRLDSTLLDIYRRIAVPTHPAGYHRRGRDGWYPQRWEDTGRAKRITPRVLDAHLSGSATIAATWTLYPFHFTRHAVIDLDVHDEDHERLHYQLGAVQDALGDLVLIRSSSSRGLHCYLFLDQTEEADRVRPVIAARLERASVRLRPGHVELYPDYRPLRLPLGRGSCILDEHTFEPLAATERRWTARNGTCRTALVRDVPNSILLLERLASERRHKLTDLARTLVDVPASGVTLFNEQLPRRVVALDAPAPGELPPAGRYRGGYDRLFNLRFRLGLPREEARQAYEEWLRTAPHTSRDLTGPHRERTIRRMLRDADRALDRWDQDIAAGRMFERQAPTLRPATTLHQVAARYIASHRRAWRAAATAALTPQDEALIVQLTCPWLERRVRVLVGLLRCAAQECSQLDAVTIGRPLMRRLAGGRKPPRDAREAADRSGQVRIMGCAHTVVLEAAVQLGFIRRIDRGVKAKRASLWAVSLPS